MTRSQGFSVDWLALRSAADERARSATLIETAATWLRARPAPHRITDLGAGTGATLRALAEHLPTPQAWALVDADETLLKEAMQRAAAGPVAGVSVAVKHADLLKTPLPVDTPPSLVTASALFDLASADFIDRFADRCAGLAVPVLAMLTYDGLMTVSPKHPDDDAMIEAFNAHQRTEKTFGRAAGPDGPRLLADAFRGRGYSVKEASTPWVLTAVRDAALIDATLKGWAVAAREMRQTEGARVDAWLHDRLADTQELVVGHADQWMAPGSRAYPDGKDAA